MHWEYFRILCKTLFSYSILLEFMDAANNKKVDDRIILDSIGWRRSAARRMLILTEHRFWCVCSKEIWSIDFMLVFKGFGFVVFFLLFNFQLTDQPLNIGTCRRRRPKNITILKTHWEHWFYYCCWLVRWVGRKNAKKKITRKATI